MGKKRIKPRKNRRWLFVMSAILLGLLLIFGATFYYYYSKMESTLATMHKPLKREQDPDRQFELGTKQAQHESINILLLGVDQREGDKGRSDTMILLSLNPVTNEMMMVSVPRDTYVSIPGYGMDKINHAYAFGNTELAVQTFEDAFNLPVNFYALVNMEGFKQGIDAIGGVTIENEIVFSLDSSNFQEGKIHLNGQEALDFIRMRKNDPHGDLGRNDRQRKVVTAALDEAVHFSNIKKVGNILNILGENVKTDFNPKQMTSLFIDYRNTINHIKSLDIKGTGKTMGKWYYVVSDDEFSRIHDEITKHMEAN